METKITLFTVLCVFSAGLSFAEDTIVPFDAKLALNVFGKYNIGIFQQESAGYRTDKPWDVGLGIRYKNFAFQAYIPISVPDSPNDSFDVAANFYLKKMYYETFLKRYKNFFAQYDRQFKDDDKTSERENAGLDVMNSGILAAWVYNYRNHSLRSVFTLSEKQTVSSGSVLYGFGVFFTSIYSQNEAQTRYSERQHIAYFGPTAGYSYTWVFRHDLFLNLMITFGTNLGINMNNTNVLFIPQITPKITFGHHHTSWSINVVIGCNTSVLLWGKDFDIVVPATMSMAFSKRF